MGIFGNVMERRDLGRMVFGVSLVWAIELILVYCYWGQWWCVGLLFFSSEALLLTLCCSFDVLRCKDYIGFQRERYEQLEAEVATGSKVPEVMDFVTQDLKRLERRVVYLKWAIPIGTCLGLGSLLGGVATTL